MHVRDATIIDAAACAAVYEPYVRDTAITFELDPPSTEQMAARISEAQRRHAWLIAEHEADVVGYAYAGPYKARPAYRWSCEVSVYLDSRYHRMGAGRALYEELFVRLERRGYRVLVAGMTLPNARSEGLHRAMGFEPVGVWRNIGWKSNAWHDVAWCQRTLGSLEQRPEEPR